MKSKKCLFLKIEMKKYNNLFYFLILLKMFITHKLVCMIINKALQPIQVVFTKNKHLK